VCGCAGVILFVLVTGSLPWKLEKTGRIADIDRLLVGKYHIPSDVDISDNCKDLISRMIVADSDKRAPMQQILAHPWLTGMIPPASRPKPAKLADSRILRCLVLPFSALNDIKCPKKFLNQRMW
jgi:serine/threonine protein kinase